MKGFTESFHIHLYIFVDLINHTKNEGIHDAQSM